MAGWVDKSSNSFWSATTGTWDGSAWDSSSLTVALEPSGGWEVDYRPTHIRLTITGGSGEGALSVNHGDVADVVGYQSLEEELLGWSLDEDITELFFENDFFPDDEFSVTKIEFYEAPPERGEIAEAGAAASGEFLLLARGGSAEAWAAVSGAVTSPVWSGGTAEAGATTAGGYYREFNRGEIAEAGAAASGDFFNYTNWINTNGQRMSLFYEVTLTGAADGETDLILPSKSFQARLRSGDPTYLSVIVPDVATYAAAITARANGQLYVESVAYVNGAESLREEVIRVDLESIRTDQGATEQSVSLAGHLTESYGANNAPLQNVMVRTLQANGKLMFRCATPDFYLKPGNIATYKTDSITVGLVMYMVSVATQYMLVTEGVPASDDPTPSWVDGGSITMDSGNIAVEDSKYYTVSAQSPPGELLTGINGLSVGESVKIYPAVSHSIYIQSGSTFILPFGVAFIALNATSEYATIKKIATNQFSVTSG